MPKFATVALTAIASPFLIIGGIATFGGLVNHFNGRNVKKLSKKSATEGVKEPEKASTENSKDRVNEAGSRILPSSNENKNDHSKSSDTISISSVSSSISTDSEFDTKKVEESAHPLVAELLAEIDVTDEAQYSKKLSQLVIAFEKSPRKIRSQIQYIRDQSDVAEWLARSTLKENESMLKRRYNGLTEVDLNNFREQLKHNLHEEMFNIYSSSIATHSKKIEELTDKCAAIIIADRGKDVAIVELRAARIDLLNAYSDALYEIEKMQTKVAPVFEATKLERQINEEQERIPNKETRELINSIHENYEKLQSKFSLPFIESSVRGEYRKKQNELCKKVKKLTNRYEKALEEFNYIPGNLETALLRLARKDLINEIENLQDQFDGLDRAFSPIAEIAKQTNDIEVLDQVVIKFQDQFKQLGERIVKLPREDLLRAALVAGFNEIKDNMNEVIENYKTAKASFRSDSTELHTAQLRTANDKVREIMASSLTAIAKIREQLDGR